MANQPGFYEGHQRAKRARSDGVRLKQKTKTKEKALTSKKQRAEAIQSATAIEEAKAILEEATPLAIKKLIGLLDSDDERIVFSAAREILDRQLGKPTVSFDPGDGQLVIQWRNEDAPLLKEISHTPPMQWDQIAANTEAVELAIDGDT